MHDGYFVTRENEVLLTDLYELTMAAAYWANGINSNATFELYFRRLPPNRSYILTAGLEQIIDYLLNFHFSENQIEWLRSLEQFRHLDPKFFDFLSRLRFTGELRAIPEGTTVFPLEPLLQITAPLIEAQILETYLLNVLNSQSMMATKAARMVKAATGRSVIDFGARRAQSPQAALYAARASYIAGCPGTSNVLAAFLSDIPAYGTTAHSFTMAFESELDAFQAYHRVFPKRTVLLLDTYDTLEAARKAKFVGNDLAAVRIDSGDLLDLSRKVRKILDEDGLQNVQIMVSGDLNEFKIADLLSANAPIDSFGVGTELVTSYDAPALNGVYKLVEMTIGGKKVSRIKTSQGKPSYPGRKQVYRHQKNHYHSHDLITLAEEEAPEKATPMLQTCMQAGKRVVDLPLLAEIRKQAALELDALDPSFHDVNSIAEYPVVFSERLKQELRKAERSIAK
jgi:nicotinate phosphoribosyltransferase